MTLPPYMDHQATTPLDPRVLEAMLPYFGARFGNASSRQHAYGWQAERAVERAREQVAALLGVADPKELLFTSGATEANNLAIRGVAEAVWREGAAPHLVTVATEHSSVLAPCRMLAERGATLTELPVDAEGFVDLAAFDAAMQQRPQLVCVMLANNEVGTLQRLAELSARAHAAGALVLSDVVQAVGKVPVALPALGVDLASLSAHKLYGPQGVGALYVRRGKPRVELEPLVYGGQHERGLRAGTLNVPGIVGFGAAGALAAAELPEEAERISGLRAALEVHLSAAKLVVNGPVDPARRLPGTLNVSVPGVDGEVLLMALRDVVALSSGSACASADKAPSHVLTAMGRSAELAHASLRFGLGRFTTRAEVDDVGPQVVAVIERLRQERLC